MGRFWKRLFPLGGMHSFSRLRLHDEDILVIRHPEPLLEHSHKAISDAVDELGKRLEITLNVLVLDEGMELGVLSTKDSSNG